MASNANVQVRIGPNADTERTTRICEALGLDPARTTELQVDVQPGGAIWLRWSGARRLTKAERERLGEIFA